MFFNGTVPMSGLFIKIIVSCASIYKSQGQGTVVFFYFESIKMLEIANPNEKRCPALVWLPSIAGKWRRTEHQRVSLLMEMFQHTGGLWSFVRSYQRSFNSYICAYVASCLLNLLSKDPNHLQKKEKENYIRMKLLYPLEWNWCDLSVIERSI